MPKKQKKEEKKELTDLERLAAESKDYDLESQEFIKSMLFVDKEIAQINEMKATSGWKVMEKKIRSELQIRIKDMVKDDLKIQTLLALLSVADTKSMSQMLEAEIARILPE